MRSKVLADLRGLIRQPRGMLVCCGPPGSDWTSTLYACLSDVDPDKKIVTVEDSITYPLANIIQKQIDAKIGQTFAVTLLSIVEQHPAVIMIGEIQDAKTAAIAWRAAADGSLVFSGMQAIDTLTALYRILDFGVEPALFASATSAMLAQRRIRTLCETCKEPYKPKPEFLRKANIPPEAIDVFYRTPEDTRSPCPACGGTGYVGHSGIFELLVISEPIRRILRTGPSLTAIKAEGRKNGLIYLQEDGLRLVIQGRTSIAELLRVVR